MHYNGRYVTAAFVVGALLLPGAAAAYLGQIVSSFRAPDYPDGLARSDGYLFVLSGDAGPSGYGVIYRCHPATGSVYGSFLLPTRYAHGGLYYSSDAALWFGEWHFDYVFKVDADTGSILHSWYAGHNPMGMTAFNTGDGGVGTTNLITTDGLASYLWYHNPTTGSVVGTLAIQEPTDADLAYDWRNQWIWASDLPQWVYGYRTNGQRVREFWMPVWRTKGLAYYGEYLWVGCTDNETIYQVHCPVFTGVAPASLGRVKALYR
jgi:hypothetical protein